MEEIWKDVVGFEGLYQVSNVGNVKSISRYRRILKPFLHKGYAKVTLCKNYHKYCRSVHRLVAEAFLENNSQLLEVNHKDGIRNNNIVSNLEWCSRSENEKHAYKYLNKNPNKTRLGNYGQLSYNSIPIIQKDLDGNIIGTFESSGLANLKTGISCGNIWSVLKGRRKTAGGFIWEYMNK